MDIILFELHINQCNGRSAQKKFLAPMPASMPKPAGDVNWSDGTSEHFCGLFGSYRIDGGEEIAQRNE
jgi:hypothetical protein